MADSGRGERRAALTRCDTNAFLEACPPSVAEIFRYWDSLRQGSAMPRRAGFHPEAVPRHLPAILLIDVEGLAQTGLGHYRYRVVRTESVPMPGRDPTGQLDRDALFCLPPQGAIPPTQNTP